MTWWHAPSSDPADVMKRRLDKIERNNEQSVIFDHLFARLSILTIAVAALLGIAKNALAALVRGHLQGVDLINLAVAFLFVLVMNRGLLAAARNIRRKQSRRERVQREDWATMWGVALIESVSLGYMLYNFEQPHDGVQWVLLLARASVIPYATIYLETQRQQPIDPQDIAIQTEIATGIGVLRDIVTLAHAPDIPTSHKVSMYLASADLTPQQAAKLDAMQEAADALQTYRGQHVSLVDTKGQPLLPAPHMDEPSFPMNAIHHETTQTHRPPTKRSGTRPSVDERHRQVFTYLDQFPVTTARELAKQFGVAIATAQMDIRAWKAARQAIQHDAFPS